MRNWNDRKISQPAVAFHRRKCGTCELCHTLAAGMRTVVVVPLRTADATLGLLQVAFDQPDRWLEEHRRPLVAIAEMGANALQRARTMEMLEQLIQDRTRGLAALYEVSAVASQAHGLEALLAESLSRTLEAMHIHQLHPSVLEQEGLEGRALRR